MRFCNGQDWSTRFLPGKKKTPEGKDQGLVALREFLRKVDNLVPPTLLAG